MAFDDPVGIQTGYAQLSRQNRIDMAVKNTTSIVVFSTAVSI